MKIKHYFEKFKDSDDCIWNACVNINGKNICINIICTTAVNDLSKCYYIGYVSPRFREPVIFGSPKYENNVNYILQAIKKYLEGDTSHIMNRHFCVSTPDNI